MLNSKLNSSYSRISSDRDLSNSSNLDTTQARFNPSNHGIEALQSGVLVERAVIATELSRLMERTTEEERKKARRGGRETEGDRGGTIRAQCRPLWTREYDGGRVRVSAQRRAEECEAQIFSQSKQVKELESTVRVLKEETNVRSGNYTGHKGCRAASDRR